MYSVNDLKNVIDKAVGTGNEQLIREIFNNISLIRKDMPGFEQFVKAQNIITKDGIDPTVYNDKPYLVTTENQRYFDSTLPMNAKSACVILGAGDTVFELVSRGVTNIVALDINDLQFLVYALKKASLMVLNAKDYERFLIDTKDSKFLAKQVFEDIKLGFGPDEEIAYNFWQELFNLNESEDIKEHLFKLINKSSSQIRFALPYLGNKKTYYDLRQKLEQATIKLEQQDAINYLKNVDTTFDYIDITNILLFFFQLQCDCDMDIFKEKISVLADIYHEKLNDGGVFVLDYWFGFSPKIMYDYVPQNPIQVGSVNLYIKTYELLSKMFNLDSIGVSSLIDGIKSETDTVLLTKRDYKNKNHT